MIRRGCESDLNQVVELAREFWKHTIYDDAFCEDTVYVMANISLGQNLLSILEINSNVVGFACGIKGTLLANCEVLTGTELAWWVSPEHRQGRNGIGLMRHLEGLAKSSGIKYWNMMFMESSMPDAIEAIYKKMGYKKSEVAYTKVL